MKSSKPFAFVLWTSDKHLPIYLQNRLSTMSNFAYMHFIRHKAEEPRERIIRRSKAEKPKPHYHCVVSFSKPMDYDSIIKPLVMLWASTNSKYGDCPYTYLRTHEGKVNNISAWLAYVIHHSDYMRFLEHKHDKPEAYKHQYDFNDIESTDYQILENQAHNALSFIKQCCDILQRFDDAKDLGANSSDLPTALMQCQTYSQMLVVKTIYSARRSVI